MILSNNSTTNIQNLYQISFSKTKNKLISQLITTQGILESGLGNRPSKLATTANNLFGIKYNSKHDKNSITFTTDEYINGKLTKPAARFAVYNSIDDCVNNLIRIYKLPRYANLWSATDFNIIANRVREDGYATDPKYSTKLVNIFTIFKYLMA